MSATQQVRQWGQIVAKAQQDDQFKQQLLADPAVILKEYGLELPAGVQLRVLENTDKVVHLTLPAKLRQGELSDDDLENAAGGALGGILKGLMDTTCSTFETKMPSGNVVKGGSCITVIK